MTWAQQAGGSGYDYGRRISALGEALRTYLRRKPAWQSLVIEAKENGEELTPYTFRHRYAKASHARGIAIAQIAEAMGHTIEVHMQNYARFKPDATADHYAKANLSSVN